MSPVQYRRDIASSKASDATLDAVFIVLIVLLSLILVGAIWKICQRNKRRCQGAQSGRSVLPWDMGSMNPGSTLPEGFHVVGLWTPAPVDLKSRTLDPANCFSQGTEKAADEHANISAINTPGGEAIPTGHILVPIYHVAAPYPVYIPSKA